MCRRENLRCVGNRFCLYGTCFNVFSEVSVIELDNTDWYFVMFTVEYLSFSLKTGSSLPRSFWDKMSGILVKIHGKNTKIFELNTIFFWKTAQTKPLSYFTALDISLTL